MSVFFPPVATAWGPTGLTLFLLYARSPAWPSTPATPRCCIPWLRAHHEHPCVEIDPHELMVGSIASESVTLLIVGSSFFRPQISCPAEFGYISLRVTSPDIFGGHTLRPPTKELMRVPRCRVPLCRACIPCHLPGNQLNLSEVTDSGPPCHYFFSVSGSADCCRVRFHRVANPGVLWLPTALLALHLVLVPEFLFPASAFQHQRPCSSRVSSPLPWRCAPSRPSALLSAS